MTDAAVGIYLSTAVLSRATWEIERAGSVESAQAEVECARRFLADSYSDVRRSIRRVSRNQDVRLKAVAERVLEAQDAAPPTPSDRT